jgi:glyoxylase-like metal-dependent hydrolase (beta-lactamase superfamily II)
MKQISEGIYFLQGQDEFIPDSHVYVIGRPSSADLTLVDAGLAGKGRYKFQCLKALGLDPLSVRRVIMTHTHFDHIGCLKELSAAFPDAELWVHRAEADPLEAGDDRTVYGMEMFRAMCMSQYGLPKEAFRFKVHRKLEGGEILSLGETLWEVIHIPGHSAGSIALYNKEEKVLIPGDVVYADYAIGRFDLFGADPRRHRESLFRLAELEVDVLLPGHNRIMTKVKPGYILDTARQWEAYLA